MSEPTTPNGHAQPTHPRVVLTAVPAGNGKFGVQIESNIENGDLAWKGIRDILLAALNKAVKMDDERRNLNPAEMSRIVIANAVTPSSLQ